MDEKLELIQRQVCAKYDVPFFACNLDLKVGISPDVRDGIRPIYGVRVEPIEGSSGWLFWAGEGPPSEDPDFYMPLHGIHLSEWAPLVLPYLGLSPGWYFCITEQYEDVWYGGVGE